MLQATKILSSPAKSLLILALILMISSMGACGILSSDESPSLNIKTDKDLYSLDEDEYIGVEIENTSDQTIYYSTCLARELEIIDAGELIDTISFGVCYCLCPAKLEPGEKVSSDVSKVLIAILKDKSDQLMSSESISYRLKYSFYEDKAWGDKLLPVNELRSNEFDLILPE